MGRTRGDAFPTVVAAGRTRAAVLDALRVSGARPEGVSAIARRAQVSRPTAYRALAELAGFGLAAREARGWVALAQDGPVAAPAPKVRAYRGDDGVRRAWADLIAGAPRGSTIWRVESPYDRAANKALYPDAYWRRAGSSGDMRKVTITNPKTAAARRKNRNRMTRFVPRGETLEHDVTHAVCRDRTLIVSFRERRATLVESAPVAAFYRDLLARLAAVLPAAATISE